MPIDSSERTLQILHKISSQLEDIARGLRSLESVMKIGQGVAIDDMKKKLLASRLRAQIYELCDMKHSGLDISRALGRAPPLITRYLKDLEQAGLVAAEQRGKQKYYYKVI